MEFWEKNKSIKSFTSHESKNVITDSNWSGGDFLFKLNQDRNQIIISEIRNPFSNNKEIIREIQSEKLDSKLMHVSGLYYFNNQFWFRAYNDDYDGSVAYIGYYDLLNNLVKCYSKFDYFPDNWGFRWIIGVYEYSESLLIFFDVSNYFNPTDSLKVLQYDGEFSPIDIKG